MVYYVFREGMTIILSHVINNWSSFRVTGRFTFFIIIRMY